MTASVRVLLLALFTLLKVGLPSWAATGFAIPPQGVIKKASDATACHLTLAWAVAEDPGEETSPDGTGDGLDAVLNELAACVALFSSLHQVPAPCPAAPPGKWASLLLFLRYRNLRI